MDKSAENKTAVNVEYQCQHLTCRMSCYNGTLQLNKDRLTLLKQYAPEGCFKSPSGVCKIGSAQDFKIISIEDEVFDNEALEKKLRLLELEKKNLTREYKSKSMKLQNQIRKVKKQLAEGEK